MGCGAVLNLTSSSTVEDVALRLSFSPGQSAEAATAAVVDTLAKQMATLSTADNEKPRDNKDNLDN